MNPRGIFVTGTDTGVGKTVVSMLLLAALRDRGIPVAAMKPVETGCAPEPQDALALRSAAGSDDPLNLVCPYRFPLPVAPQVAAEAAGERVEVGRIADALERLSAGGRFVLVEGAGGTGTPYAPGLLGVDLAAALGLPALLVSRAVLGTVGQTLVCLGAFRAARVSAVGVLLNRVPGLARGPDDPTNARLIQEHAQGVPVFGILETLPSQPPGHLSGHLGAWIRQHAAALPDGLLACLTSDGDGDA